MKYHTSPTTSQTNLYSDSSLYRSTSPLPPPATINCLSATTKSYKYLRKLVKFDQMDFEFAIWQMVYLFISPQKLYRNFSYRKRKHSSDAYYLNQFVGLFHFNYFIGFLFSFFFSPETKSQFARDDPAFLVLLILCVFGKPYDTYWMFTKRFFGLC